MYVVFLDTEYIRLLTWRARSQGFPPVETVSSFVLEWLTCHHTPITIMDDVWHLSESASVAVPVHAIYSLNDEVLRRITAVISV